MRRTSTQPRFRVRMWMVFFAVFVTLVVGGGLYREYKLRVWNNIGRFTVLYFGDEVVLESVDPQSKEAVRVRVPAGLLVQTAEGKGKWKASSLQELAVKHGWKWAGDSVADYLGVPYTVIDSNMHVWDRIQWKFLTRSVLWKDITLEESAYVSENLAIDDVKVLGLDNHWDDQLRNYFLASDFGKEQMQLLVVNSSSVPGVATKTARILDASGIRVVKLESKSEEHPENCLLKVHKSESAFRSVAFIKTYFNCDIQVNDEITTATLLVGTTLANRFSN